MNLFSLIATLFTSGGAILMAMSILRTRRILTLLAGRPKVMRWQILQVMIFFFFLTYLLCLPLLATARAQVLALLVGVIFFGGSLFVGLTIAVSLQTIEDLVEKEEALVAARDEALEASRMKTALLTSVTHELRTPLQSILGYEEMLRQGVYGALTPKQAAVVERVRVNARRLSSQIGNLLAQAAIEEGEQIMVNMIPFAPAELLETVEDTLYPLAARKRLALHACVGDGVPPILDGDLGKLQDIALNLAGNAIKFTPQGTVEVQIVRPDAEHWALRVADTGPGIPQAAQGSILKPFQRAGNLVTHTEEGMGLGLALVQKWTKLLDGELILESVEGEGTVFTVIFPLNGAGKEI